MKKLVNGEYVSVGAPVQALPVAPPAPVNDIELAVGFLVPGNEAHWTKSGLPDLNAVALVVGRRVSRAEVEAAAPGVRRPVVG